MAMNELDNQVATGACIRDDGTIYQPKKEHRYCYSEEMAERVDREWLECFDD